MRIYGEGCPGGDVLVWAHGGGFRHGDLEMPEAHMVAAELARRAGVIVVSVGYRLATGTVRYPVPIDDVHAVWGWVCTGGGQPGTVTSSGPGDEQRDRAVSAVPADGLPCRAVSAVPGDEQRGRALSAGLGDGLPGRVAIGGASAGAALALATAMRARDAGERTADLLVLAYPFVHYPSPGAGDRADIEDVEDMVRNYVGRISDVPPDALPGMARLDGLPPVTVVLSEDDYLRPSGELLERQLREVGVPVETMLAAGTTHGHLNRPADHPDGVEDSLTFFAKALATMKPTEGRGAPAA
ncbi:alpha/beta hydrolase fold domain-containing protein [Actinoplanes sp. NPDC051851]|uniref:alpha/beta hydrolase n=1 Tax=Actinoplanes sp. NPDC051851 TaxID=3154753 RepID=UPI00342F3F7F